MKNVAKHPCSAQTGWSNMTQTRIPKYFGKSTTPSAPSQVASRIFLMSRPPLLTRRGICRVKQQLLRGRGMLLLVVLLNQHLVFDAISDVQAAQVKRNSIKR
jgi:hypothetical protein